MRIYKEIIKPRIQDFKIKYKARPNQILNEYIKHFIRKNELEREFTSKSFRFYGQILHSHTWACIYKKDPNTKRNYLYFPQLYIYK